MEEKKAAKTVVSGMRPTGRLHLGNYWGALRNWVELQGKYRCFFFIADWHALTTAEDTVGLRDNTRLLVVDWLTAGLDPERCVIFRQSDVKEHAEFALLMGMMTPISWLLRNPTFKEQLQELYKARYRGQEDKMRKAEGVTKALAEAHGHEADDMALHSDMATYGFLGYPVLQAADIALYGADYVPVGRDQLPHLELSREIVRRFNRAAGKAMLAEPEPLLTGSPLVPGLDGRKMSKSYGNAIELGEDPKSAEAKIKKMFTDPKKIKADDPGHPEGCVVCAFHRIYNPDWKAREDECRSGKVGCGTCKKQLAELMAPSLADFKARREPFEKAPALADRILAAGAEKARAAAAELMSAVNSALRIR